MLWTWIDLPGSTLVSFRYKDEIIISNFIELF